MTRAPSFFRCATLPGVLALEADEVHSLTVAGEELPDGLLRIGRLEQLDVADARRQDRVQEAELLRLSALVHLEAEEARVPLDRLVHVLHHHRQLDDVAKHALSSFIAGQRSHRNRRGDPPDTRASIPRAHDGTRAATARRAVS
jgi:hypothetical protein